MSVVEEDEQGDAVVVHGRRRSPSRHLFAPGVDLPLPVAWLLRRGSPILSLLPALVAVSIVQSLSAAGQRVPVGAARFATAGAWASVQPGALAGYSHWWDASPWGWLQLGAIEAALGGGARQSVLAAVHGAMLLIAIAAVVLVWALARRMGAGSLAAGAAAAVFAISPVAVTVHTATDTANIAVCWLLACALLVLGRSTAATVGAGVVGAIAVLTSPSVLLAVPFLIWMLLRTHRADGKRSEATFTAVVSAAGVVALAAIVALIVGALGRSTIGGELDAIGQASAAQVPGVSAGADAFVLWLTTDPLGLLVALIAIGVAIPRREIRPVAALAVALFLAGFWPLGGVAVAPIVLLLPFSAVLTAFAIDRAIVALGRPRFAVSMVGSGWLMGIAAVIVVAAGVWAASLGQLQQGTSQPLAKVEAWVRTSVPAGQLVMVDLASWPDLASSHAADVGWYAAATRAGVPVEASASWTAADYVVVDSALDTHANGEAGAVLRRSLPVATFGTGAAQLQVKAVPEAATPASPSAPTAAEAKGAAARVQAGKELAENPRLQLSGDGRALLESGQVDTRLAIVLGQLLATHSIVVAEFPAVTGDTSAIRRQALISGLDGKQLPKDVTSTGVLLRYLSSLRGDYAAARIDVQTGGVLATFSSDPTFVPSS